MKITFILVEPARPENIGAAARALKTMGFSRLRLVNAGITEQARWVAHESGEILEQAEPFADLESALADVDFSIATTARRRLARDDYLNPTEATTALHNKAGSIRQAALVFGRESSGLTNEELALCDAATSIPLKVEQPSLNLAQAVMLYAWELSKAATAESASPERPASFPAARDLLRDTLTRRGLDSHPNIRRWAEEGLARFSERDLGMLMQILRRL